MTLMLPTTNRDSGSAEEGSGTRSSSRPRPSAGVGRVVALSLATGFVAAVLLAALRWSRSGKTSSLAQFCADSRRAGRCCGCFRCDSRTSLSGGRRYLLCSWGSAGSCWWPSALLWRDPQLGLAAHALVGDLDAVPDAQGHAQPQRPRAALPGVRDPCPLGGRRRLRDPWGGDGFERRPGDRQVDRRRRPQAVYDLCRLRQPDRRPRTRRRRNVLAARLDHTGRRTQHPRVRVRPCGSWLERDRRHNSGRRTDSHRPPHLAAPRRRTWTVCPGRALVRWPVRAHLRRALLRRGCGPGPRGLDCVEGTREVCHASFRRHLSRPCRPSPRPGIALSPRRPAPLGRAVRLGGASVAISRRGSAPAMRRHAGSAAPSTSTCEARPRRKRLPHFATSATSPSSS